MAAPRAVLAEVLRLAADVSPYRFLETILSGPLAGRRKLLARLGMAQADFDMIELNEAFASQGLATLRLLGIVDDDPRVNPNGGAIALGHPLGMTGARLSGTAALQLATTTARRALAMMCIGVGQGIALGLERV